MFILCSDVQVHRHEYHYHQQNRNRKNSLMSLANDAATQSKSKQKIHLITAKNNSLSREKSLEKSNRSKDIKQKCIKGLSKTKTTNKTSSHQYNELLNSFQLMKNPENLHSSSGSDSLKIKRILKMQNSRKTDSFRISNPTSQISNNDTLITFKNPMSLYDRIKHKRQLSGIVNTVVSQESLEEMEEVLNDKEYVIEESVIYDHNVNNKFKQITNKRQFHNYREFLAVQSTQETIISIKEVPIEVSQTIVPKELQNYAKINEHPNILAFYQINLHYGSQLLIKQPYTSVVGDRKCTQAEIENILEDIGKVLYFLKGIQIHMDQVLPGDIREVFGVYKLADLSRSFHVEGISVEQNLTNLKRMLHEFCQY